MYISKITIDEEKMFVGTVHVNDSIVFLTKTNILEPKSKNLEQTFVFDLLTQEQQVQLTKLVGQRIVVSAKEVIGRYKHENFNTLRFVKVLHVLKEEVK